MSGPKSNSSKTVPSGLHSIEERSESAHAWSKDNLGGRHACLQKSLYLPLLRRNPVGGIAGGKAPETPFPELASGGTATTAFSALY